ncbi:hypothetical protein HKBW3S25_02023, partial [Candidatus Hakubella thermalkaliphila]
MAFQANAFQNNAFQVAGRLWELLLSDSITMGD